jgi:outer membrane protein assembly factor BamB
VPLALSELGAIYEELRRPGDAARAFKKLLILAPDDRTRASALWGLARSYEAQKLWVSAREAYLNASQRFGGEPIVGAGSGEARPLAALVAERLAREPFDRMLADRAEPIVPVPLKRRWERHWAETSRPIGADGLPPSAESGRVFLAQGSQIRPVDPASGASAWSRDLEGEPIWVGYLADRIIAATKTRVVALSLDKGEVEWRYNLCASPVAGAAANPFAREPAADGGANDPGILLDFRIVGNRVFCLKGHQSKLPAGGEPDLVIDSLMAFDGDTGQVDWSFTPTNGRINRHLLAGPRRIVLQVRKPNQVLVLDTATGRRQTEFAQGEADEWPRDPLPLDDDHVALVVSRTKVAKFDITKGLYAWEFEETRESPRLGAPRIFCDSERLLVLHDGQNLMRLDLATGSKVWKSWRLLGNEDLSERPEAVALAPGRVFVINGSTLAAFNLVDGSPIWKRLLNGPSSGWDLALTERSVVAFPEPSADGLMVLPLVFHRRDDGEPIQRILFQAPVMQLAIRFSSRGALVATQAGGWAIGDRQVMDGSRGPR